jgi:hypothetical protein
MAMRCKKDAKEHINNGTIESKHLAKKFHGLPTKSMSTKNVDKQYSVQKPT